MIVVGGNTFIQHLMEVCGFENVFASANRYPEITENQLREVNPDLILLSSEPYPFKNEHIEKFRMICPQSKIFLVDGEMFSWYGSRLIQAPIYFQKMIQTIGF